MQFRKNIPSLTALVAVEAVIRRRSFTAAAQELNVTQAAVSRQIAALEKDFGTILFVRGHRSIEPTAACLALGNILTDSFARMAEGVDALRSSTVNEVVTIGASLAFSALWLLPRLGEFRRLHPDVQIRVISQDSKINLDGGQVDIAVRYGLPPFADGTVLASCGDEIFPVCSPEYFRRLPDGDFWKASYDQIETDQPDRTWYSWHDWFAGVGHAPANRKPSLRFSHYTESISAARAGQGVALGWRTLVDAFLRDGTLVRIGDAAVVPPGRYNVIVPLKARRNGVRDLAAGWMTAALHNQAMIDDALSVEPDPVS
ncbi:MAG: LysR substrate-binding domain-containing protein [Aurantimonas endophytica]|uniref:LysR substrate-binding domain-containing protein n=1 Tax=Aurantimonas endophytica TaxID=1522175 RepID=UPI003003636B